MATKVKGDKIKEGSINLKSFDTFTKGTVFNLKDPIVSITKESKYPYTENVIYALYNDKAYRINKGEKAVINQGPPVYISYINNEVYIEDPTNFIPSTATITLFAGTTITIPTPNWNAQEGEAGYIENKPFYDNISNIVSIDFTGTSIYYEYNISTNGSILLPIDKYLMYNEVLAGSFLGKLIVKASDLKVGDILSVGDPEGLYDFFYRVGNISDSKVYIYCDSNGPSIAQINEIFNFQVCDYATITLDDKYLPDSVLKTTPQSLSDDAKNQVKENLGIATPNWNALEGEAGYIENKAIGEIMYSWDRDVWYEPDPLSVDDLNNRSINFDSLNAFDEEYRIGFRYVLPLNEEDAITEIIDVIHDIKIDMGSANLDGYVNYNKYSIIGNMEPGDKRYIYSTEYNSVDEDPYGIQIYYYKEASSYYLEISMSYLYYEGEEDYKTHLEKYIKKFNFAVFCNLEGVKLKQINYDLLPSDVVSKKTENLSQYQKNKILANLGIDPVVWKYMCNPIFITSGDSIPADLLEKITSLNDSNYVDYLFLYSIIFGADPMGRPNGIQTFYYQDDIGTENYGTFKRCLTICSTSPDIAELCIDLDTGMVDYRV